MDLILLNLSLLIPTICALATTEAATTAIPPSSTRTSLVERLIPTGPNRFRLGKVEFDKKERTVAVPARVRLLNEVVEYALVTEQGKGYESMFVTSANPTDIHLALLLLDIKPCELKGSPGKLLEIEDTAAVTVHVSWNTGGEKLRIPLSQLVLVTTEPSNPKAEAMSVQRWLYNGSTNRTSGFAAESEGSVIALIEDAAALINNPAPDRLNDMIHFPHSKLLPPVGTEVEFVIRLVANNTKRNDR